MEFAMIKTVLLAFTSLLALINVVFVFVFPGGSALWNTSRILVSLFIIVVGARTWIRHFTKRRWLVLLLGVAATLAFVGLIKWRTIIQGANMPHAEPFRIAGNLYYVGTVDDTAFLLTGPEGHVLIDGGYP